MKWSKRALLGHADSDEYIIFKSVPIFQYYFYQYLWMEANSKDITDQFK